MNKLYPIAVALLGLLLLYTLALGTRRAVLEAQYRKVGSDLPFTLESALQYRRVKMVYDTGQLPVLDRMIQYPDGVENRKVYNLGSEFLYARWARLFPDAVPFAHRLRWLEAGWFCLGIPLLALWLRVWRRSWWAAGVGAAFYAVAVSNVIRSTGQELSRENFALPILIAHYLADALVARSRRRWTVQLGSLASAALLVLALASWDLIQYAVLLRMGWMAWRILRGRVSWADPLFRSWSWQWAGLLLLGILHPYYRSHGWWCSPAMLMGYANFLAGFLIHPPALVAGALQRLFPKTSGFLVNRRGQPGGRRLAVAWLGIVLTGFLLGQLTAYGQSYSHFGALLWAKLRFFNVKPADPALLNFDQRILWVPALNSATPEMVRLLFPFILYLTIPAVLLVFYPYRKQPDPKLGELLISLGITFIAFVYFARFHVYLALYASALLGVWAGQVAGYRMWLRWLAAGLLGAGWIGEAAHTLQRPERWGRVNVYYKELDELADWLKEQAAPDPVAANFGVSAYVAAYGKCAVLLHPKFEDQVIRQRVRAYGEQLFRGTEQSFRDWADALGARYYVHGYGEFSRAAPELQMRYFVNALDPAEDVPARLFEAGGEGMRYFERLWQNPKYAVYRILTRADEALASRHTREGRQRLEAGDLAAAQRSAEAALRIDARQVEAAELLALISRLQEAGFEYRPGAE